MKPIKCPNCGKNMIVTTLQMYLSSEVHEGWVQCASCGVRGPVTKAPTERGAVRKAARLMREWIARMNAKQECKIVAMPFELTNEQIKEYMDTGIPPTETKQVKQIMRSGAIDALRWAARRAPFGAKNDHITNLLIDAITRLENGGDL